MSKPPKTEDLLPCPWDPDATETLNAVELLFGRMVKQAAVARAADKAVTARDVLLAAGDVVVGFTLGALEEMAEEE